MCARPLLHEHFCPWVWTSRRAGCTNIRRLSLEESNAHVVSDAIFDVLFAGQYLCRFVKRLPCCSLQKLWQLAPETIVRLSPSFCSRREVVLLLFAIDLLFWPRLSCCEFDISISYLNVSSRRAWGSELEHPSISIRSGKTTRDHETKKVLKGFAEAPK